MHPDGWPPPSSAITRGVADLLDAALRIVDDRRRKGGLLSHPAPGSYTFSGWTAPKFREERDIPPLSTTSLMCPVVRGEVPVFAIAVNELVPGQRETGAQL